MLEPLSYTAENNISNVSFNNKIKYTIFYVTTIVAIITVH